MSIVFQPAGFPGHMPCIKCVPSGLNSSVSLPNPHLRRPGVAIPYVCRKLASEVSRSCILQGIRPSQQLRRPQGLALPVSTVSLAMRMAGHIRWTLGP